MWLGKKQYSMALRIPWNEYEEAILLCTLINVLEHKIERMHAVAMVSEQLRKLATLQGISIDEKFRNKNGIFLQMSKLEYAFTNGRSGLHVDSGWYFTIVDVYRNDIERFRKMIGSVSKMLLVSEEEKKLDFVKWIKKNNPEQSGKIIASLIILGKQIHSKILKISDINEVELLINKISSTKETRKKRYVPALTQYREYLHYLQEKNKEYQEKPREYRKYDNAKKVSFSEWLSKDCGMADRTIHSYESAIRTADTYVKEHNIGYGMLQGTSNYAILSKTMEELFQVDEFNELNKHQHNRFSSAMRKYLQYIHAGRVVTIDQTKSFISEDEDNSGNFDNIDLSTYKKIILKKFPRGFRIDSILELKRFRALWKDENGIELSDDDESIRKRIAHITIRYKDFVYLPEMMASEETKNRILAYIEQCFRDGKAGVYFDALYKEFQPEFKGKHINNPEMLRNYLSFINEGRYFIDKNYLTVNANTKINPADEIKNYMISVGTSITVDDLKSAMSHIDANTVYWTIAGNNSEEFIRNKKGEYFHADIIQFTQHEMDIIKGMIQQAINNKGYMGGKELTDEIGTCLPSIIEQYPFLTWLGLRDVIAYKMKNLFSFKGKIISPYGKDLSMANIFARFAETHNHFTLAQLNALKHELDTNIYFDEVYAHSLRISEEEFVSRDQAAFDTQATDNAISRFCTGEYIPLREVSFFGSFPNAGFSWNIFLLEHYVANFSPKFKLLHIGFNANKPVGAIVRRNSRYDDFDELIVQELADSKIELDRESALQYLVDIGLLGRKNYKMIDQAVSKAKLQRQRKG